VSLKRRAALAVLLSIGFYLLAVVIAAALLLAPLLELRLVHTVTPRIAVVCVAGAALLLWSVVPRAWSFVPPGPRLLPGDQPRLFRELEEVARLVRERLPDEVYASGDAEVRVLRLGGGRAALVLGLPMLGVLRVAELRALVLHELVHHRSDDTRFGPWVHRTREAIARILATLDGRRAVLHVSFVLYGVLFLRVTRQLTSRQELAADALAAEVLGPDAVWSALRSTRMASLTYQWYWRAVYRPPLEAGLRPPLAHGFAAFLTQPRVADDVREIVDVWMAQPRPDPFDGHPLDPVRLAALFAAGEEDEPDPSPPPPPDAAALELLDGLPGLEAGVVSRLLPRGAGPPEAVAWTEVAERALVPRWRRLASAGAAALEGETAESLWDLSVSAEEVGARAARVLGMVALPADERQLAVDVLGAGLALGLVRAGWRIAAEPVATPLLSGPAGWVEPFVAVGGMLAGEVQAAEWRDRCARLGIGNVSLTVPDADLVALPPDPGRVLTARLVTDRCTTGWMDWCHGELWLTSEGLLRRRVGWPRAVARELRRQFTGPTVRADRPRWEAFAETRIRSMAAAHRTNHWVPSDRIRRAWLRKGLLMGRLRLELVDGRRLKLFWLRADPVYGPLRAALTGWLGDRLTLS
jgi:Zn-dependent protease with chaperone function